jgi:hypothetical protein
MTQTVTALFDRYEDAMLISESGMPRLSRLLICLDKFALQ